MRLLRDRDPHFTHSHTHQAREEEVERTSKKRNNKRREEEQQRVRQDPVSLIQLSGSQGYFTPPPSLHPLLSSPLWL